jgi:hypothetical protein
MKYIDTNKFLDGVKEEEKSSNNTVTVSALCQVPKTGNYPC